MNRLVQWVKYSYKRERAYTKAYTNNPFWRPAISDRQSMFKLVAIKAAQFMARGWILDIGTGLGYLPIEIAKNCANIQVVGIDIAIQLINDGQRVAKEKGVADRVAFLEASAESLPFHDSTFDTVQSMFSLHQWHNRQRGINEIHRVLKSGGRASVLVGRNYLVRGKLTLIKDWITKKSITELRSSFLCAEFKEVEIKVTHKNLNLCALVSIEAIKH